MPDYPVQGRLRIRQENFERDLPFIKERVGEVQNPKLKPIPGFEFLKFWYIDFAATSEQWQALAPELDRRNIGVTMFEAPTYYMEALAEAEQGTRKDQSSSPLRWLYSGLPAAIMVVAVALFTQSAIDAGVCVCLIGAALLIFIIGQLHLAVRE